MATFDRDSLRLAPAPSARQPLLLLAGFEEAVVEPCRRLLAGVARVEIAQGEPEVRRWLDREPVAVLCLGPGIAGLKARHLLDEAETKGPAAPALHVLMTGGADPALFQDLLDADRIFYLSRHPLTAEDLAALLASAVERVRGTEFAAGGEPAGPVPRDVDSRESAARSRRVLEIAGRLATQRGLESAVELLEVEIAALVAAERVHVRLCDRASQTLPAEAAGRESRERGKSAAAVGLMGFIARTGRPAMVERLAEDPRFEQADDPEGTGDERFLAVPVSVREAGGARVLAVLAAVRLRSAPPFAPDDLEVLRSLAERAAPALAQIGLEARLGERGGERERLLRDHSLGLFREEAVDHALAAGRSEGDPLRLSPRWMRWTYSLLVGLVAAALLYSLLGTVREYASGPAVVRLSGRTEVTANAPGTVTAVEVRPGEQVAAGRLLVRFYGAQELAELRRIEREFELQLVERLRDPTDPAAEQALIGLRAQRELAQARLEDRSVRAPSAGTVADVRVRPGQSLAPGQILVSLATGGESPRLVALLPGEYRPQLAPGMPLRLELQGYRYLYQHLTIERVGDEVVGPEEARRALGPEIADSVTLEGPVVFVWARLPGRTFAAEGRTYEYRDGLVARAEVQLRSERIIELLVPGLKALRRHG